MRRGEADKSSMKKIKIDKYTVYEKGRTYEILKFPFIKHMWAFDDFPEENMLMVDGCKEAFMWMKYAFAILAEDSEKIIYFPCKQDGIGCYYPEVYHLVLCRPELQFQRSLWFRIKSRLDKKHYSGKYAFSYDRKKLDDYYESGLGKRYPVEWLEHKDRVSLPFYLLNSKNRIETILGDTMFLVMPGINWLDDHYITAKDMEQYKAGEGNYIWSAIGWIVSDGNIRMMYKEAEEERKKCLLL